MPLNVRHVALDLAARAVWRTPGCFGITRILGPSYSLRCVVFHNVSATESPFTKGMGVTITPVNLARALKYITRYYTPVSLEDVLTNSDGRSLPQRAMLVTFDDGYASAMESATLCRKLGVPATFFLNAAFLGNYRLAPDNLVCYAANVLGMATINRAIRVVKGTDFIPALQSLAEVFGSFFPTISLPERKAFLDTLIHLGGVNERLLAREAGLYLTREHLSELASLDFEIGNHTYTHVHCRSLTPESFGQEVDKNKAELEAWSGRKVRSFSVPYGSSADLTSDLVNHLKLSGYEAVFLSESAANGRGADRFHIDRVSTRAGVEETLFFEIEILPRLRAIRSRFFCGSGVARTARKAPSAGLPALATAGKLLCSRKPERTQ